MNHIQRLLVKLLSAAVRNTLPQVKTINKAELEVLYEEARAHQTDALLYMTLKKMNLPGGSDANIMSQWEKSMVLKGILQIQHIRQINRVLYEFSEAGIPAVILKGLVLRNLYPRPEFRTMTDADILLQREDIERAKELLSKMGYVEMETSPVHIHFENPSHLPIELHWQLVNNEYIKDTASFDENVWNNALPVKLGDANALMLSFEDQVIHLILHMAVHMLYSGFGLRQLCDFVLLVENKAESLNWDAIHERLSACGLERFTSCVFSVSGELLGLETPYRVNRKTGSDKYYHKLMINEIFAGGVFGKRNLMRVYSLDLLEHSSGRAGEAGAGKLKYFVSLAFPPVRVLREKFKYAEKTPLLVPAAWFNYCMYGIRNKNFSVTEKVGFFFSTLSSSRKRSKLLQWLDLQ